MALIYCPECGNQISQYAEICNKCSYPIAKRNQGNFQNQPSQPENHYSPTVKQTDLFAVVAFAAGLGGFVILPILFIPIGYVAAIVSYYRLRENKNLKGNAFRIIGAILTTINILWIMYKFKIGFFSNSGDL